MFAPPNAHARIGVLIKAMTAIIARLLWIGAAAIPYGLLTQAMFMGLSNGLAALGLSRADAAALLAMPPGTLKTKRRPGNPLDPAEIHEGAPLAWTVLQYLQQHPQGVTQRKFFEDLEAWGDERKERRLLAILRIFLEKEWVWQAGGAGNATRYRLVPEAWPANDSESTELELLAALQDHLQAMGETITTHYEDSLYNRGSSTFFRTFRLKAPPDSVRATQLLAVIAEFVKQLDALYEEPEEEIEGDQAPRGEISVYVGTVWRAPG